MKTRVALIAVPPLNTRFPALNIALLAGELKATGYPVKCFDLNIEAFANADPEGKTLWDFRKGYLWLDEEYFKNEILPKHLMPRMEGWLDRILAFEPDLIGISVTPNTFCVSLAQAIRERRPKCKIIFGGPMCSKVMGDTRYQPTDLVDVVVSDEGEHTLLDIVKHYEETGSIPLLQGANLLVDGKPTYGGQRHPIEDLDGTAYPDFSDLNLDLFQELGDPGPSRELPIYTSRGCVGRCNFCMDYKMWAVNYRQKSPKRVIDEMEHFSKTYGVKNFIFIELVFNGHHGWIRVFADELKRRKLRFYFWSHGRVDGRLSLDLLKALKEVGFKHFIFGMESASDKVLKLMRKGTTRAKAEANLRDCFKAGIGVSVNVIVGYPGETFLDFVETALFIVRHRKLINCVPSITPCYATPGTDLYLNPEKFGIKIDFAHPRASQDWVSLDGKNTFEVRWKRKMILERICAVLVFGRQRVAVKSSRFWKDKGLRIVCAVLEPLHYGLAAWESRKVPPKHISSSSSSSNASPAA